MKKLYFYRYLNFWLASLLAIGVPIGAIATKYALVEQSEAVPASVKASGVGLVVVILAGKYFIKHMWRMYKLMDEGSLKRFVVVIFRIVPLALLYMSLLFIKVNMTNFEFVLKVALASNSVASLFVFNHLRLINKIEGIKDVQK